MGVGLIGSARNVVVLRCATHSGWLNDYQPRFLWCANRYQYCPWRLLQVHIASVGCCYAGITIVVMTSAFIVLTDMEQPFSGFVRIDTSMFLLIRRDIRVVLRSAHMEQLETIERQGRGRNGLTESQTAVSICACVPGTAIRSQVCQGCRIIGR